MTVMLLAKRYDIVCLKHETVLHFHKYIKSLAIGSKKSEEDRIFTTRHIYGLWKSTLHPHQVYSLSPHELSKLFSKLSNYVLLKRKMGLTILLPLYSECGNHLQ